MILGGRFIAVSRGLCKTPRTNEEIVARIKKAKQSKGHPDIYIYIQSMKEVHQANEHTKRCCQRSPASPWLHTLLFKETGEALLEVLAQESSCLTVCVMLKISLPMPAALNVQKLVFQSLGMTNGALAECRQGPAVFLFLKDGWGLLWFYFRARGEV